MPELLRNKKSGKINHQFRSFAHTMQDGILKLLYPYKQPQGIQGKHCKALFCYVTPEEAKVLSPQTLLLSFLRSHFSSDRLNGLQASIGSPKHSFYNGHGVETTLPKTQDRCFCNAENSTYRQPSSSIIKWELCKYGQKRTKGQSKGETLARPSTRKPSSLLISNA